LGTIDESDQNLQTVPKRHIFQDPAFSWLLEK
ncbi:MAG: GFA family protein, partial [Streptococcus mitis]|nr:GFA family protein [Streptococcus mitis]